VHKRYVSEFGPFGPSDSVLITLTNVVRYAYDAAKINFTTKTEN
jgi:hypothetical protein